MTDAKRLDNIIESNLTALDAGIETVDSVLEKYPKDAGFARPRLEAALWLSKAKKTTEPRPGFISSSRSYLEQRIAGLPPRNAWQRLIGRYTPQRWIFNIAAPALLIVLIALIINSLVLTARLSIPGDPFYSTKLVLEDIRLAFTFNLEDKTDLYIQYSRERTTEFVELVIDGDYELLPSAADRMETEIIASLHSINAVSSLDPTAKIPMVASLRDTLSNEIMMLSVLKRTLPTSAQAGLDLGIQIARSGEMALR